MYLLNNSNTNYCTHYGSYALAQRKKDWKVNLSLDLLTPNGLVILEAANLGLQLYSERDSNTDASFWILQNF